MAARATVSQKIRAANWARRASGDKVYHLARLADVHPSVYSSLMCDLIPVSLGDPRVLRIAAVLGVPAAEAFTVKPERK